RSPQGKPLGGVLLYPANYVKGETYPMVVYVYERQSNDLHQYIAPNPYAAYNPQMLSQSGYFVLMPDIAYERKRHPGQSALECTEAALDAVLAKKLGVDPARIGIVGHSWGGYEAAFISTVSGRFAAAVCGSGLTDFASLYGNHYYKTGTPSSVIMEVGQARMQVPIWEDREAYLQNSAVWQAPKRKAPLLIQVGDKDDLVDWNQGLSLYNALRRLGKEAVLLVYRNEGHRLMGRANQKDYAARLRHFLDVYLKGAKPEPWLGQPYAP
ncbi:MAG TPA: prolyl oligopeptidase family serine peptidase, partial [Fimbriimonas sp.]